MTWPEGEPAQMWIDILLLDTLIRDVLGRYRKDLLLWRIHRRADTQDTAGHQFTFLTYTEEQVAAAIDEEIKAGSDLRALKNHNLLREYFLEREMGTDIDRIEGTSDKSWVLEVQKSWPYYIMGVSEMLLDLVHQLKRGAKAPALDSEIDQLRSFYFQLNNELYGIWQHQGSHAFLHHLNALFGYISMITTPGVVKSLILSF